MQLPQRDRALRWTGRQSGGPLRSWLSPGNCAHRMPPVVMARCRDDFVTDLHGDPSELGFGAGVVAQQSHRIGKPVPLVENREDPLNS